MENARFVAFLMANMGNLYVETNMSQILMDHSIHIRYSTLVVYQRARREFLIKHLLLRRYNNQWYTLSREAQKLMIFMTVRCNAPSKLVAGKILTISIENFVTARIIV